MKRLHQQVEFLLEIDKLKTIFRRTRLLHADRFENDAEHSWHLALAAMVLAEYANEETDMGKVIAMVLVHDLVEIYAGDTYCYDEEGARDKKQREEAAADRIFGLLPKEQGEKMRALWEEFEGGQTPEARFANAVDRFQPVLFNLRTGGRSWEENGITRKQVDARVAPIALGSKRLWQYINQRLDEAVDQGILQKGD
ncbi:MAG TPA: HD domain-containing protein [Bacillota bacterium]|nr:HD domain-containing protein [Bacillota bacterium]HPZ22066.1 HD domain-containing protein [Bacillota bacterium]HQD19872.1 HD domain-containing protein [Bacillota bacterium]